MINSRQSYWLASDLLWMVVDTYMKARYVFWPLRSLFTPLAVCADKIFAKRREFSISDQTCAVGTFHRARRGQAKCISSVFLSWLHTQPRRGKSCTLSRRILFMIVSSALFWFKHFIIPSTSAVRPTSPRRSYSTFARKAVGKFIACIHTFQPWPVGAQVIDIDQLRIWPNAEMWDVT